MKSTKITLYKNHRNSIGYWSIWYEGNIIHIEHAQTLDGARISHTEMVTNGRAGRTIREQIRLRIRSRVLKQLDKGYVKTLVEAQSPPTNTLGLAQPMLALPIGKVPKIDFSSSFLQYKLNGHRCLMTKRDGEVIAYSRQGKQFKVLDHLTEPMSNVLKEGETIDGELYLHGAPLQKIASLIKRDTKLPKTESICYYVYDIIDHRSYSYRLNTLESIKPHFPDNVFLVDTHGYESDDRMWWMFSKARDEGYEGLILRQDNLPYETGRRSKSLVKIKATMDAEFLVAGMEQSKDGWAILRCLVDPVNKPGVEFKVSAPGDIRTKHNIWQHREDYVGTMVTVEFSELTSDGVPFHPVATGFRKDL